MTMNSTVEFCLASEWQQGNASVVYQIKPTLGIKGLLSLYKAFCAEHKAPIFP